MRPRSRCAPASAFVPPPLKAGDPVRPGLGSITVFDNDSDWRPTGILDPYTGTERLVYCGPEPIGFLTFLEDRE